jgi:hypothetical protein
MITIRFKFPAVIAILLLFLFAGCSKKENKPIENGSKPDNKQSGAKWERAGAEAEYRLIKTELTLAEKKKPYLVIDLVKKQLVIKLNGVDVWNYAMEIEPRSNGELNDFAEQFMGNEKQLVRPILEKHLFSAKDKSSDSVLAIVSEAVLADVDLMQRIIPERFQLLWDNGLILEIRTSAVGQPTSKLKNTMVQIRQALQRPFGESLVIIRMDQDHAITLYRMAERGLPTMLYPGK